MTEPVKPVGELVENPHVHEIFADEVASISLINGVLRVTFMAIRENGSAATERVAVSRLAMPLGGAQGLCLGLMNFLKSKGWNPSN